MTDGRCCTRQKQSLPPLQYPLSSILGETCFPYKRKVVFLDSCHVCLERGKVMEFRDPDHDMTISPLERDGRKAIRIHHALLSVEVRCLISSSNTLPWLFPSPSSSLLHSSQQRGADNKETRRYISIHVYFYICPISCFISIFIFQSSPGS